MPNSIETRRLIWVPVVHTQADLGSLSAPVREFLIRQLGPAKWKQREKQVSLIWEGIGKAIAALNLDYSQTRLFQDGLPVCGKEEEIVRDLAQVGSENHQLLLDLISKGARLMGTESSELLIEEYGLARQTVAKLGKQEEKSKARLRQDLGKKILEQRDAFIAGRIENALQPGETGLVFLGALHSLKGRLSPDIEMKKLGDGCLGRKS